MTSQPEADVVAMKTLCGQIEKAIAKGEVAASSAANLKGAIDETRMRVWAALEAQHAGDPDWVQDFWLRRAAEVCVGIVERLERGEVDPASPKAEELKAAAHRLAAAIGSRPPGPNPPDDDDTP